MRAHWVKSLPVVCAFNLCLNVCVFKHVFLCRPLTSHTCSAACVRVLICVFVSPRVSTGTLESVHSSDLAWWASRIIRLCCRTKKNNKLLQTPSVCDGAVQSETNCNHQDKTPKYFLDFFFFFGWGVSLFPLPPPLCMMQLKFPGDYYFSWHVEWPRRWMLFLHYLVAGEKQWIQCTDPADTF